MKKQTGNTLIILVIIVLVALLGFWFFMKGSYKGLQQTPQKTEAPAVENKSDLDSASKDLDGTNLNQMDLELNLISSDSSSF